MHRRRGDQPVHRACPGRTRRLLRTRIGSPTATIRDTPQSWKGRDVRLRPDDYEFTSSRTTLADVLDRFLGNSERNIQSLFQRARDYSPCVVFLDELDAIGGRRNKVGAHLRNVVTQLLTELDSVAENNEGVFLLAATNHPWDIDPALRRPGRLDRMLFVPPPDEPARAAILTTGLRDRPTEGLNITAPARRTEGLSGADLSHLCDRGCR